MKEKLVIIGVDGGATKASAWSIFADESSQFFSLGRVNSTSLYSESSHFSHSFEAISLGTQLAEKKSRIEITSAELEQGHAYVETCANAIVEVAKEEQAENIIIGIGMAGRKTNDLRGLDVVANGPRILNYCDQLEQILENEGINLMIPIARLGSDADYCGLGENYALDGMFRGVKNAYYLGGGTGVADAFKLRGKLIPQQSFNKWIANTWEFKNKEGHSMELITSIGGIQKLYAKASNTRVEDLNHRGVYPLQMAKKAYDGDKIAMEILQKMTNGLVDLIYERIVTLSSGWSDSFDFVFSDRNALNRNHNYIGECFERIVIGQRLRDLIEDNFGNQLVKRPLLEMLDSRLQNSPMLSAKIKDHYKDLDRIIVSSGLREAPALGAGIEAWKAYSNKMELENG